MIRKAGAGIGILVLVTWPEATPVHARAYINAPQGSATDPEKRGPLEPPQDDGVVDARAPWPVCSLINADIGWGEGAILENWVTLLGSPTQGSTTDTAGKKVAVLRTEGMTSVRRVVFAPSDLLERVRFRGRMTGEGSVTLADASGGVVDQELTGRMGPGSSPRFFEFQLERMASVLGRPVVPPLSITLSGSMNGNSAVPAEWLDLEVETFWPCPSSADLGDYLLRRLDKLVPASEPALALLVDWAIHGPVHTRSARRSEALARARAMVLRGTSGWLPGEVAALGRLASMPQGTGQAEGQGVDPALELALGTVTRSLRQCPSPDEITLHGDWIDGALLLGDPLVNARADALASLFDARGRLGSIDGIPAWPWIARRPVPSAALRRGVGAALGAGQTAGVWSEGPGRSPATLLTGIASLYGTGFMPGPSLRSLFMGILGSSSARTEHSQSLALASDDGLAAALLAMLRKLSLEEVSENGRTNGPGSSPREQTPPR